MTRIGFIGAGMMAEAIIGGMLKAGFSPAEIGGADSSQERRLHMEKTYGIKAYGDNQVLIRGSDAVILSVKPQYYPAVLPDLLAALTAGQKVFSIMAGIPTERLEREIAGGEGSLSLPVVRAMPNSPALVGAGMTILAAGRWATEEDMALARRIFAAVGGVIVLEEGLIDAAGSVSGCGPAYAYMMIQALADGGVMMGLPRQIAQLLAAETLSGSARMVLAGAGHPEELKDRVCSPGGTTIEGVSALERAGFRGALMEAVRVSAEKNARLGK
ncbi:MAG: pyrroline-5-carboxylate reductase [Peptococcaceae bacterium]|jgi:pyrroline-5-carboxylate reductase|nr:pyrroline-5-carboxylate reductase [Peptococcaceae bacterium]